MNAVPKLIPWIGSKARLAKHILPLFPAHTCYVEPFAGSAALFFRKEPSECEVLNDVNGDLVNLYRVVQHHLDEFVRQFRWALVSRELWKWLDVTPVETLTDIQRAARFYYLQRLGFGGKIESRSFGTTATTGPKLNLLRIEEDLSAAHVRLARVTIEKLDWQKCIDRYDRPHTLFYIDPPYWGTEGYGVPFEFDRYRELATAIRSMRGKAIVSVNDIPQMHEVFSGLSVGRAATTYTLANSSSQKSSELVIRNF
jgi:DNA adenine methylase